MNKGIYKIESNERIAKNIYKMILSGDTSSITKPGQFINISLEPFFLRRPISVCDYDDNSITIIYKVVGKGTDYMSMLKKGDTLDVLCGLGNGYNVDKSEDKPLVIGGGVGVPPLYNLAKKLIEKGKKPIVLLGFGTKDEVFYEDEFKALGCIVKVSTVDGSYGTKGIVTDILPDKSDYNYFFTCGPLVMMKALSNAIDADGQLSFEERMGCGFGACVGCSIQTKNGIKRICKEGPVLEKGEIIW
ncbi:MAG: dihydroorotate dehydrogenase electron transfer subunit [Clostridia bacterium]|nr:dihydroorotate dehydrogenase electron transfer subunit [Clostridia bacterium]